VVGYAFQPLMKNGRILNDDLWKIPIATSLPTCYTSEIAEENANVRIFAFIEYLKIMITFLLLFFLSDTVGRQHETAILLQHKIGIHSAHSE